MWCSFLGIIFHMSYKKENFKYPNWKVIPCICLMLNSWLRIVLQATATQGTQARTSLLKFVFPFLRNVILRKLTFPGMQITILVMAILSLSAGVGCGWSWRCQVLENHLGELGFANVSRDTVVIASYSRHRARLMLALWPETLVYSICKCSLVSSNLLKFL